MLSMPELEQLAAFADLGTLSRAAEELNVSQPTITRSMQHLEDEFGVPLFERTKNRISLNETGKKAAEHAKAILKAANQAVADVRAFDRSLHTIIVSSCAPFPLWALLPRLSSEFPGQTLHSSIRGTAHVLSDLEKRECHAAILTRPYPDEEYASVPFMEEYLYISVPPDHALAKHESVSFKDINGHNFLLARQLGFWDDLCREKMPASRFHVQESDFAMQELIRQSSLPCFATNKTLASRRDGRRVQIPITDPEARVDFYLVFSRENKAYAKAFERIAKALRDA